MTHAQMKTKLFKEPRIKKVFDVLSNDKNYQLGRKIKEFRISLGLSIKKFKDLTE